ncbi:MAG: ABC transporter substrate-binding protein [Actinomycetota bacterium]
MLKRLVLAAVALSVLGAACTNGSPSSGNPASTSASGNVKEGGTLRLAAFDGIDSLNPFVGQNDDAYSAYMVMYPYLVQYDSKLNFIPDFATSWTHASDGMTWTFKTAPNATWSDGQPLTAEDVAFTYNMIIKYQDGPTGSAAGSVAGLDTVTTSDADTVVFHYAKPVPSPLAAAQQIAILPQHVWGKLATGDGKDIKTFANTPSKDRPVVCGGPFVVTEYQQDAVTLFQKNPNFYGPAPHIDGFGLQFFANEDAEVTAIKTGQIDAIESVPTTSVATLKSAGINVYTGPALTYRTFIINSSPNKTEHRELLDPKVREAFEYAIDRQKIVQTAWLGYAQPGSTIVPPSTGKWHDANVKPLPFDLGKANALLDSLGFDKGSGGIRVADGHPMTYDVLFPNSERGAGDRSFSIIQNDFAQIGVKLVQRPVSGAYSEITGSDNKYASWDLAMWNWTPPVDPDFILSVMTCDSWGDWNDSGYCNSSYDATYAEQQHEIDAQQRLKLVYALQAKVAQDRPYIVLNYDDTIDAWTNQWTGFVQSIQGLFPFLSKQSLESVHQV